MMEVLSWIFGKLARSTKSRMVRVMEKVRRFVMGLSELAVSWENIRAVEWRFDEGFQRAFGMGLFGQHF
jgi:hypothetical protein